LTAVVVLEEPAALERDTDRLEHLLHRQHVTGVRVRDLGETVVLERLLDFDGLAGLDELVHVCRHGNAKNTEGPGWSHESGTA